MPRRLGGLSISRKYTMTTRNRFIYLCESDRKRRAYDKEGIQDFWNTKSGLFLDNIDTLYD